MNTPKVLLNVNPRKTITFEILEDMTVKNLKGQISKETNQHVEDFDVVHNDEVLADDVLVVKYGIKDGAAIEIAKHHRKPTSNTELAEWTAKEYVSQKSIVTRTKRVHQLKNELSKAIQMSLPQAFFGKGTFIEQDILYIGNERANSNVVIITKAGNIHHHFLAKGSEDNKVDNTDAKVVTSAAENSNGDFLAISHADGYVSIFHDGKKQKSFGAHMSSITSTIGC